MSDTLWNEMFQSLFASPSITSTDSSTPLMETFATSSMDSQLAKDKLFIAKEVYECTHKYDTTNTVLHSFSFAMSFIVFLQRARIKKHRQFPDSIVTITLGLMIGFHLSFLVGPLVDHQQMLLSGGKWDRICHFQSWLMQWSINGLVWNWICVSVALYCLTVRQIPMSSLAGYTKWYYFSLLVFPIFAAVIGAIGNIYGKFLGMNMCWIKSGIDRFYYFYTLMVIGVIFCIATLPAVSAVLWKASRAAADDPMRARIFKEVMIQQTVYSSYFTATFIECLLYGVNNLVLEVDESYFSSPYVKKTTYTYCVLTIINIGSYGAVISIIFGWTQENLNILQLVYKRMKRACCCCCCRTKNNDIPLQTMNNRASQTGSRSRQKSHHTDGSNDEKFSPKDYSDTEAPTPRMSSMATSTTSGGGRHFRSAFDSTGQTAVSIPPEPQDRLVHNMARSVYTRTILEYAREQLLQDDRSSEMTYDTRDTLDTLDNYISETESTAISPGQSQYMEISEVSTALEEPQVVQNQNDPYHTQVHL